MTTIRYPTEPEPYIWLQEDEEEGSADCGCYLLQDPDSGAKLSFCTMHAAAEEMLATLEKCAPVLLNWSNSKSFEPTNPEDDYCQELADAQAVIRRARGGKQ